MVLKSGEVMNNLTSIDLRGVPRGRCKNTECDCPEFSRDTAPLTANSAIPAGWCAYCGHSPAIHGRLEYLGKQIFRNVFAHYIFYNYFPNSDVSSY